MVVGGIEQFLRDTQPDLLTFTGSTKLGKDSLYAAMVRTLGKRTAALGYYVTSEKAEGETVFQIKPLPSAS
ncbi:MAG: hypothetical protein EOO77_24995 [Oxalobacteraceae bacterium]|nr:MAG: hypothetical protein EOO77_24995 [Oxalobacteraceae bacterium]